MKTIPKLFLLINIIYNLLKLKLSQICGKKKPLNTTDCTYNSYQDQACCFINYNETIFGCLFVPQNSTFITPYITSLNFGMDELFSIKIDCGKDDEKQKRICKYNPITEDDCFELSNTNDDCCFFQTAKKEKFCLWNSVKQRKNSIIFGTNITCYRGSSGYFLENKTLNFFLLISFLMIILS